MSVFRPQLTVSASFRLTDVDDYFAIAEQFNFGSPVMVGEAPQTVADTYANGDLYIDGDSGDGSLYPAVFVESEVLTLLGQTIPTTSGSGTLTGVSYTDGDGDVHTEVDWVWTIDVIFYVAGAGSGRWDQEVITYVGNGVNGRTITTSFALNTGVVVVWVFPKSPGASTFRHSGMSASITVQHVDAADGITGLTATGFTVSDDTGNNVRVNVNLADYTAIVMRDTTSDNRYMTVGSYSGNGVDDREITTTLTPDLVWILGRAQAGAHKSSLHPAAGSSAWSNESKSLTTQIKSFTSSSFTVGTDNNVNNSSLDYYWVAIANPSGSPLRDYLKFFTFTGAGIDHQVTGIGWTPGFAGVKQYLAVPTAGTGYRSSVHTLLQSTTWAGTLANTIIESLDADGLTVSSTTAASGTDIFGVVWKATGEIELNDFTETPLYLGSIDGMDVDAEMATPSGSSAETDIELTTVNPWLLERFDLRVRDEED